MDSEGLGCFAMINMPYEDIIRRIKEEKDVTDEELNSSIKKKMDQLSGLISKEGAAYIVANDLGVKLVQTSGLVKIKNIVSGLRNVETAGKVMQKFDLREFETERGKGKVQNFIIADETGEIRVTAWNDQVDGLKKFDNGDIIKVENGFIKTNQGRKEVHLNDRAKITVNPPDIKIEGVTANIAAAPQEAVRKKISELKENDQNVEMMATIVQVYDPRFFEQCPECRKRPTLKDGEFVCETHGTITPAYGYVTNVILDDGTDSIRIVCFKEQMQELFAKTDSELLKYKDSPEKFEEIKTELLGEQIIVTGRINRNAMFDRLEMIANKIQGNIDPEQEIEKLNSTEKTETVENNASEKEEIVENKDTEKLKSAEKTETVENKEKELPSIDDL